MLEAMLSGKSLPSSAIPVLGYDFNRGVSTGSTTTVSNHVAGDIVTYGDKSAGYDKGLLLNNKRISITPMSALSFMQTENFTIELWCYVDSGPSGYTTMFEINYDNGKTMPIRLGDNGFGNRLQFSFYAAVLGANWSTPVNRSVFSGGWHHVALVKEGAKARIYYDGVLQSIASGTSTSYTTTQADVSSYILKTLASLQLGGGAYNLYLPEIAVWISAKYSANFTPKKGSLLS